MDAWHRATSFSEAVNCLATDGANGASAPCLSSQALLCTWPDHGLRMRADCERGLSSPLREEMQSKPLCSGGHKAGLGRSGADRRGCMMRILMLSEDL